jgi:hypothetical protein
MKDMESMEYDKFFKTQLAPAYSAKMDKPLKSAVLTLMADLTSTPTAP